MLTFSLLPTCWERCLKQCVHNKFPILTKGDRSVLPVAQKWLWRRHAWRRSWALDSSTSHRIVIFSSSSCFRYTVCTNFPSILITIFIFYNSKLHKIFAGPGVSKKKKKVRMLWLIKKTPKLTEGHSPKPELLQSALLPLFFPLSFPFPKYSIKPAQSPTDL